MTTKSLLVIRLVLRSYPEAVYSESIRQWNPRLRDKGGFITYIVTRVCMVLAVNVKKNQFPYQRPRYVSCIQQVSQAPRI